MTWNPEQDAALASVDNWIKDPDGRQVFRLFGYAGTGKTTLAKHLAEGVDGEVMFMTYTGKAAHVLRKKGCDGATTIHSMIYNTREKSKARLLELENKAMILGAQGRENSREAHELREEIARERSKLSQPAFSLNEQSLVREASLIVVDEVSMVDGRMGEDLLSFKVPVLVLGDPAQLPPVAGNGFFINDRPDVMLTEIHRQAKENPIIAMATRVREGGRLELGRYGESQVIGQGQVTSEMAMEADQILVGKNKTRRASNKRARSLLGRDHPHPIPEDRLVCLRNNHDLGLMNGALWEVDSVAEVDEELITMSIHSTDDDAQLDGVHTHMHHFVSDEKMPWYERNGAEEFDYGYALTTHKAQGSQFANVFMFDESWVFRDAARNWLYTAITRASEKITIVKT